MSKGVFISKALAVATVAVTASAVGSIVAMVIVYQIQYNNDRPTPPPTFPSTTPEPSQPPPDMRLPENLIPESYEIFLQVHLYTLLDNSTNQTFTFSGNSTVNFKCVKATDRIYIHTKELNLTSLNVKDENGTVVPVTDYILQEDDSNFLEIELERKLMVDETYSLFTEFEGVLSDELSGLYTSKYTKDGEERLLATSQMQPTDARKVFPCFDEPAMKAVFYVTIIHREGTIALSNGVQKDQLQVEIDDEKWLVTEFHPTPKMSTYLLAFTVCDFTYIESTKSPSYTIRTYARPDAIDAGHAEYARNITGPILLFFESHFGIKYPLGKLDQIALPDFSAGAMENWGLITYRETALLYDEGVSSTSNKEWITSVISHELAHQWFGNLVTMKWWNDLWLNEGFATYISYLGVDHIEPSWTMTDLFVLNEIQPVFQVDSLVSSHPLSSNENDVQTPDDIISQFDAITYSKGAAVLRMLSDYISKDVFQEGLREYLSSNKYSNAEYKDLWSHLQTAVDNNNGHHKVAEIMETWIQQMGYPVITINTTTGDVSQQHFLLNQTSDYNFIWQIPVKLMKSDSGKTEDLLTVKGPVMKPKYQTKGKEWLLANVYCTGYYRVNYNPENWERLLQQLETNHHKIPVINRGQLIDDAFNLARAKHINVTLALYTTKYLRNETEYIPWESALQNLDYFILMFDRSEVYGPMKTYLRKQVEPLYEHFENYTLSSTVPESHTAQYNQINAISTACSSGFPSCENMAANLFQEWMDHPDNNTIDPNLRSTIYCSAIATGSEVEWEFAWGMFENASIASEKDKLRYALSCTKIIWILNKYLSYTLDPNKIRKMDSVSTINYIAKNVAGQSLAWDFVRAKWTFMIQEYGVGTMPFGTLIDGVTQRFSTEFELQQLRQFQTEHGDLGQATRALEQAIERTQANIKWVKENKHTVLEWFKRESVMDKTF